MPIYSLLKIPGVGAYDTHLALDKCKTSPVRMPIGKANIGEVKSLMEKNTWTPSPASYMPGFPYMKQETRHRGSGIGKAIRPVFELKIATTPGPPEYSPQSSTLSSCGVSGFNRKTTYRGMLNPIERAKIDIPSPTKYSCNLVGPSES